MYWIIDGLCFTIGITEIILSIAGQIDYSMLIGLGWILFYPLLLEGLYNLFSLLLISQATYNIRAQSHIVYHQLYNISLCGLEKYHPFDSHKYGNVYSSLLSRRIISQFEVHRPNKISRNLLLEVMSSLYLIKLSYTIPVCLYLQIPFFFLPGFILRKIILEPMLYATEGTILALEVAAQKGWAINLSGGYHHASFNKGGGFCIYPDITIAVHYLRTRMGYRRIMIIDCDAHQGNGYQRDLIGDNQIYIVDFYNHNIYPHDNQAKGGIKKDVSITPLTSDQLYIDLLKDVSRDMDQFQPQFVIYGAGTDILSGDKLGRLNISEEGVIARDQTVIDLCKQRNIPVTMVLSGGYQKINAQIIAKSIENLYLKFN